MILALDVGNTNIHFGLFDGTDLLGQWRVSTTYPCSADELGLLVSQFIRADNFSLGSIEGVAVACVVPPMYSVIRDGIMRYLNLETLFIDPGRSGIMPIRYDSPKEVGADRLANSVAALSLAKGPLVIVDFGTATTFDVVSSKGEYLGGAIAPGIELSVGALFQRASRLPRIDLVAPGKVIGSTTSESMQSGIVHGYAGMVDHMNRLIQKELEEEITIIATGGLAKTITPYAETIKTIEPNLTLIGIRLIYLHEAKGRPRTE